MLNAKRPASIALSTLLPGTTFARLLFRFPPAVAQHQFTINSALQSSAGTGSALERGAGPSSAAGATSAGDAGGVARGSDSSGGNPLQAAVSSGDGGAGSAEADRKVGSNKDEKKYNQLTEKKSVPRIEESTQTKEKINWTSGGRG